MIFQKKNAKTRENSQKIFFSGQSHEQQNGRLCGTQRPARFNTTSNVMSVQFHSDGSGTGKGDFYSQLFVYIISSYSKCFFFLYFSRIQNVFQANGIWLWGTSSFKYG